MSKVYPKRESNSTDNKTKPYNRNRIVHYQWDDRKNQFIHPSDKLGKFKHEEVEVLTAIVNQI